MNWALSPVVPAYAEPVSLAEMKRHCGIVDSQTAVDSMLASFIRAARQVIETGSGSNVRRTRAMMAATWDLLLDCFPAGDIEIPRVPLVSVSSVTYVDSAGATQTVSAANYVVDSALGRIRLAYNQTWPTARYQPNAITVRFVAGMAATFTAAASSDLLSIFGRSFSTGDRVRVMNSGGLLPVGLSADTDYFLLAGPKLSLTSGGTAIDIKGAGSGTHYIGLDLARFEALRSAVKLYVGMLYTNRGDGGPMDANTLRAIDSLISSAHA